MTVKTESRLIRTRESLLNAQFCAPKELTRAQVQEDIDQYHPAGTTGGWRIEERSDNPVDCADDGQRQHWVCVC